MKFSKLSKGQDVEHMYSIEFWFFLDSFNLSRELRLRLHWEHYRPTEALVSLLVTGRDDNSLPKYTDWSKVKQGALFEIVSIVFN